jgi:hypothetical protein
MASAFHYLCSLSSWGRWKGLQQATAVAGGKSGRSAGAGGAAKADVCWPRSVAGKCPDPDHKSRTAGHSAMVWLQVSSGDDDGRHGVGLHVNVDCRHGVAARRWG